MATMTKPDKPPGKGNPELKKKLGKKLKSLRLSYDLSQEQAAKLLGIPITTWRNWEQGRTTVNPLVFQLLPLKAQK